MNFDKIVGGVGCFTYIIQLDFGADPGILMKFFHCGIGPIVRNWNQLPWRKFAVSDGSSISSSSSSSSSSSRSRSSRRR